jgi:hypothetical protein
VELIDFQAIAKEMRETVAHWYNAEIEIFDPNLRQLQWDVRTNEYTGSPEQLLWDGKARVQPIRRPLGGETSFSSSTIREIRIQIPHSEDLPNFEPGMRVRVTESAVDKNLEEFVCVIRSAINSSYGWNRTIECDVDLKMGE